MANVTVKMNTGDAIKRIDLFSKKVNSKVREAIAIAGIDTERVAKKLVPVDTGRLRSSIRVLRSTNNGLTLEVGTEVDYASKIEFGIGGLAAQPYLFPAAELARAGLAKAIKRII